MKTTPWEVFSQHKAISGTDVQTCGFYWHSTRLARAGTDYIFNKGKQDFQSRCKNNKADWPDVREILFNFKKYIDQNYRNIMWHFSKGQPCNRCLYWDNVYSEHLAKVTSVPSQELTDEEMAEVAMEIDGTNKP